MLTQTIIEIAITAALIVGLFNEDKLATLEKRVIRRLKAERMKNNAR